MIEVLPAIIEDTYAEVEKKLNLVAPFVDWVQVDVADGVFVPRTTWTKVEDLRSAPKGLHIDLHIMVKDPLVFIERVRRIEPIRRVTFHYEATHEPGRVIELVHEAGHEAGLAVNPETDINAVTALSPSLDVILVMGVHPGWGGQGFIPETCDKIRAAKQHLGQTKVGVDGGIHYAGGTAQAAVDAGADFLVVGSDIFSASEPGVVIKRLQQLVPQNSKS